MSYEGYRQLWCSRGHEWRGPDDFHEYNKKKDQCPNCGKHFVQSNPVDDTNCYSDGFFLRQDNTRAPTDEELLAIRKKGSSLEHHLSGETQYFVGGVLTAHKPAPGKLWVFI